MKAIRNAIALSLLVVALRAQTTFSVTGTQIPASLLKANYGKLPSDIAAFDLNICNGTAEKHSVTASQIYQALAESNRGLQPLGSQVMLATILQNQRHSAATILTVLLNTAVGTVAVMGTARTGVSPQLLTGAALGSMLSQQLLNNLRPVLTPDQVQRFENQVLEPALVLDGGSCVERTVFALGSGTGKKQFQSLTFSVERGL